jgi:hypothetical protein
MLWSATESRRISSHVPLRKFEPEGKNPVSKIVEQMKKIGRIAEAKGFGPRDQFRPSAVIAVLGFKAAASTNATSCAG